MLVKRILFFLVLLGTWAQAAGACPEAHGAPAVQAVMEITVSAPEDIVTAGGRHRCECPATFQSGQALVSESEKSFFASHVAGAGAFPNSSIPNSVTLAERSRVASFLARPSGRPPYLLVSRLRQ